MWPKLYQMSGVFKEIYSNEENNFSSAFIIEYRIQPKRNQ